MRVVAVLAVIALTVYAVFDCARAETWERRGLPAWLWLLVIIALPGAGALVWLVSRWSMPNPGTGGGPAGRRGPIAPDDDPDFLAGLDRPGPHSGRGHGQTRRPPGPKGRDGQNGSPDDDHHRGEDRRGYPGT